MQQFGSTKDWRRLIWPTLLLVGLCAIPFTLFVTHVAFDLGDLQYTLTTAVILLVLWFVVLKHLHTVYSFPLIEIDQNYLVVCDLFLKRKVYNLNKISNPKKFMKSAYFSYNGWPALINLHTLSSIEREKVCLVLGCSKPQDINDVDVS